MEGIDGLMKSILGAAAKDMTNPERKKEGDYYDDGLLYCGKCGAPKETIIALPWNGQRHKVCCVCMCDEIAKEERLRKQGEAAPAADSWSYEEREADRKVALIKKLRRECFSDPTSEACVFANDDRLLPKVSDTCREYVRHWELVSAQNVGLLFYGGVGTGKSFYACCIANALLDKGVSVLVTSVPRILNRVQSSEWKEDKEAYLAKLDRVGLLVLDDLGAERGTSYAMEQVYSVVDARYRGGKPLLVTTNLTPGEIKRPENIGYERIYDRVTQNCVPVKVDGESRRAAIAAAKKEGMRMILSGGSERVG